MIVYGIDCGVTNLAVVKLRVEDEKRVVVEYAKTINLGSKGPLRFTVFNKFVSRHMLEEGYVRIEFQHRCGKSRDVSFYINGYLSAMFDEKKIMQMQPRLKFKFAEDLKIMPDCGDLKIYKNRKDAAIKVLQIVRSKLEFENAKEVDKMTKKDDVADALLYALAAVRDMCPNALLDLSETAATLQPIKRPHVQKIVL